MSSKKYLDKLIGSDRKANDDVPIFVLKKAI